MKDRFAITIHLTNAGRTAVEEAAALHGLSLKAFIENTLPYIALQVKETHKQKLAEDKKCEK